MVSHPELGLDPPIGSDREWGVTIGLQKSSIVYCIGGLSAVVSCSTV